MTTRKDIIVYTKKEGRPTGHPPSFVVLGHLYGLVSQGHKQLVKLVKRHIIIHVHYTVSCFRVGNVHDFHYKELVLRLKRVL